MDEELLSQLAANAGMGDDLARVQAQLLRAKAVRDQAQRPSIRTSPGGAALGALARGLGAVRADRMEQPALAEQADLDARSKLLRQKVAGSVQQLPSLAPQVDPQTGAYAPIDPAAVERHRALGNALAAQGDKGYADLGGKLSGDAAKALESSLKAANARALGMVEVPGLGWVPKSVYEAMIKRQTTLDTDKPFKGSYTGQSGGYKLNQATGQMELIKPDPEAASAADARAASRDSVLVVGTNGQVGVLRKSNPRAGPTPVAGMGGDTSETFTKGSPEDITKLNADLNFLNTMAMRLPTLEKLAQKSDVPGIGPLDRLMPAWATSPEGIQARQAATDVLNAMIYESTGKQINESETLRQKMAKGFGVEATAQEFREGVKALRTYVERAASNAVAARPPAVVRMARERGVLRGLEPFLRPGAAPAAPAPAQARPRAKDGQGNVIEFDGTQWVPVSK